MFMRVMVMVKLYGNNKVLIMGLYSDKGIEGMEGFRGTFCLFLLIFLGWSGGPRG